MLFDFFLTFLTIKNNLKRLNTKRQKKRLIFKAKIFSCLPRTKWAIFPGGGAGSMDSLRPSFLLKITEGKLADYVTLLWALLKRLPDAGS